MPPDEDAPPEEKDTEIRARVPRSLKRRVKRKAQSRGWKLSAVVRALLELWLEEDIIGPEDVGWQDQPAPKRKKKPDN